MYKVRKTNSWSLSVDFDWENIIYNLESSLTKSDIEETLKWKEKLSSEELMKLIWEKEERLRLDSIGKLWKANVMSWFANWMIVKNWYDPSLDKIQRKYNEIWKN